MMARKDKPPETLYVFKIRVIGRAATEQDARTTLARKLKRAGIEIDSGLELVEHKQEEPQEPEFRLVAVVESSPRPQKEKTTVPPRSPAMKFDELPVNLRTYYWRKRGQINDIYKDRAGAIVVQVNGQIDTWTNTDNRWSKNTHVLG